LDGERSHVGVRADMDVPMNAVDPLPRRLDATDEDLSRGRGAAHAIAASILGRDPGSMTTAASMSHYVYIGADVVVKLVDANSHTRLDREIVLAPALPPGLGAPLIASGRFQLETCDVRYAGFTRMPGTSPGPGLTGVDAVTARRWAEQAVQRLNELHNWAPTRDAVQMLRESPVHEGLVSRAALINDIECIAATSRDGAIPRHLIDGLIAIADRASPHLRADVPVHADCDWSNWLVDDQGVVALLDFERARLGEPADDWVLLALTSGPHLDLVVDVIAEATRTAAEAVPGECELRHAAFIAEDICQGLTQPDTPAWMAERVRDLEGLVVGRRWRTYDY
jgi:Phosphotransferase enzyme family